jgi:hypothetical protein
MIANIIILAHAVVPHHHHESIPSPNTQIHVHFDNDNHHDDLHSHSHNHSHSHSSNESHENTTSNSHDHNEDCILNQLFLLPSNNIDCSYKLLSSDFYFGTAFPLSILELNNFLHLPLKAVFSIEKVPISSDLYHPNFIATAQGLRAPPLV